MYFPVWDNAIIPYMGRFFNAKILPAEEALTGSASQLCAW